MNHLEWIAAVSVVALSAGTVAAFAGAWWMNRETTGPEWTATELAAFAGPACPVCGGWHCAGCEAPARITAAPHRHVAAHGLDSVPPSLVGALTLMTPAERAHELVRQLGQATWHPWRGLPRLDRIRYVAATVARRNGVPLLLGQLAPAGRLP